MKLTAKKLKQLIREELEEAYRNKYGRPSSKKSPMSGPYDPDVYMRRDPDFKPTNYGDYQPPSDEEAMESHGKAMADAIANIQKQFGLGSVTMKVSGEKAEDIVKAIKKVDSNASVELEGSKEK